LASVAGPVAAAAALTVVMNIVAGLCVARVYHYGSEPAAEIATTLVARGEFALILAAMAAGAGLDARLAPFIAGYVLVLAVLGPIVAGRAHVLAAALRAVGGLLPGTRAPVAAADGGAGGAETEDADDGRPEPGPVPVPAQASPAFGSSSSPEHTEAGH
ncbi:cation:proton antiporter domain-containing protein, partial [Streptomyces anthocyanicus]